MNKFLFRTLGSAVLIATLIGGALSAQAEWSVSIQSPTNSQVYTAPADIQLEDFVDGTSPPITALIQFYANSNLVGTYMNGPGTNRSSVMWTNVPAGEYALTAVATAESGEETSAPVMITVSEPASNPPDTNPPPSGSGFSVSITSPTNTAFFHAPATIQLADSVSGTSPTSVETVQFFANSNLIATVTNGAGTNVSFTTWTPVGAGNYTLTAIATDDSSNQAFSQSVMFSVLEAVTNPPLALAVSLESPESGQNFILPATIQLYGLTTDTNAGEVVQFFANSNLIATVTNIPGSNVFIAYWTNMPTGFYGLTAVVSNSAGAVATSLPVLIGVNEINTGGPGIGVTPWVRLVSPTNGSFFPAPANIGMEATWPCSDPTAAATVQFFANSNLIATVSNGAGTNTCFAAWTNVTAGFYGLSAVISYSSGGVTGYNTYITVGGDSTNGPGANVVERNPLPVVGVVPGNPGVGARGSYVAGNCVYLSIAATNGMAYSLESSTDLINWTPVFTNTAVGGESQYVAPNGSSASQFYRVVPAKSSSN